METYEELKNEVEDLYGQLDKAHKSIGDLKRGQSGLILSMFFVLVVGFLMGLMWGFNEGAFSREREACRAGYGSYNENRQFYWRE